MAVPTTGVKVGNILLPAYTGAPRDSYGVQWKLTKLDGWDDGWSGNGALEDRAGADGGWLSPQYAVGRLIHIDGSLDAGGSWDAATAAWERLLTQIPFRSTAPLLVSTGEGGVAERRAMVRMHEKPVVGRLGGRMTFSLSVVAPDPRRYSADLFTVSSSLPRTVGGLSLSISLPLSIGATSVSGRVSLTNAGNEPAPATLTITGPCPPARITHVGQGRTIVVPQAVETGRSLVIDSDTRRGVLDQTTSRTVTGAGWLLTPGVNEIAFAAAAFDPDALLTISHRSAWR